MTGPRQRTLEAVVKSTGDDANGSWTAVISTPTLDRDGEVWDAGWWDPLPASIPIHVDHRFMDVGAVVGRAVPYAQGGRLWVDGRYASTDRAQEVRRLVAEGMVTTMSIGAINAKMRDVGGVPHCTSAELIEASFVSVPANTDALVVAARNAGGRRPRNGRVAVRTAVARALADAAEAELAVVKADELARRRTTLPAPSDWRREGADAEALLAHLNRP